MDVSREMFEKVCDALEPVVLATEDDKECAFAVGASAAALGLGLMVETIGKDAAFAAVQEMLAEYERIPPYIKEMIG